MFGFLKRLFGKGEAPAAEDSEPDLDLGERLVRLQRDYWRPAPAEKASLAAREAGLSASELLRLHHLTCIDLLAAVRAASPPGALGGADPPAGEDLDRVTRLLPRLAGPDAPFRPRRAEIWQSRRGAPGDAGRAADHRGALVNASLAYLGALEIIRMEGMKPVSLDFVPFDDIATLHVGPPSLFRPTRITLERPAGGFVPACLPLLYGPSWDSPDDHHRDGSMTTFAFHVAFHGNGALGERSLGMGVGHQDFTFADGGVVFGLGSIDRVVFQR